MRGRADAAEFGIGDVVLGDDVGHQRAHPHEPAADADQHQGQRGQDRVQQHAGDEVQIEAARQVHLCSAADRQYRPEIAEHDQQHEGYDVVRDRVEPHRNDAGQSQQAAVAVVAGKPAQQVAETPGEQCGEAQQTRGPRQRTPDQHGDRRGECRQRRPEIARAPCASRTPGIAAPGRPPARIARAATGASARSLPGWCCRTTYWRRWSAPPDRSASRA